MDVIEATLHGRRWKEAAIGHANMKHFCDPTSVSRATSDDFSLNLDLDLDLDLDMYSGATFTDGVCVVGIPARQAASNRMEETRVGGQAVWHDAQTAPKTAELLCGNCRSTSKIVLVAQVYAPLDFDRSIYIFCCNTRQCSLSSTGWFVVRNQKEKSTKSTGIATKQPPKPPTVWDDSVDMPADGGKPPAFAWGDLDTENDGCSLDDLNSLLQIRDLKLAESNRAPASSADNRKAEAAKVATAVYLTETSLPCWELTDQEECWTLSDEAAAKEGVDVSYADSDKSEHIQRLLKSYYEGEEDTEIVNIVRQHENDKTRPEKDLVSIDVDASAVLSEPTRAQGSAVRAGKKPTRSNAKAGAGSAGAVDSGSEDEETAELSLARSSRRQRVEAYFQYRVSYYPTQVLRYAYGGEPMWITYPSPLDTLSAAISAVGGVLDAGSSSALSSVAEVDTKEENFTVAGRGKGRTSGGKAGQNSVNSSATTTSAVRLRPVPCCEWCGKDRVFECQLMPGLLSLVEGASVGAGEPAIRHISGGRNEDAGQPTAADLRRFQESLGNSLDFGVVAVYSCPDSCSATTRPPGSSHFATEVAVAQGPPDILQLLSMTSSSAHPPTLVAQENDSVNGYYTSMESLFSNTGFHTSETVNIFGVITSFTMPKSTRGSHAYSLSFAIVDPSATSPAASIFFVWFCNSLSGLSMNFRVGDIIRIEKARVQEFNGFPQLVAKDSNSKVVIFHRKRDELTGAPLFPLSGIPSAPEVDPSSVDGRDVAFDAAAGIRAPFVDPAWSTTTLGVSDTNTSTKGLSKQAKQSLAPTPPDRHPLMWPQEIIKLHAVHEWSNRFFRDTSFSDPQKGVDNTTLHGLQSFIHSSVGSTEYAGLLPPAAVGAEAGAGRSALPQNGKCDVVCLVTSVVAAPAGEGSTARMTVWDGTTNGTYEAAAAFRQAVQIALDAAGVHDSAMHQPQQQQSGELAAQLQALRAKEVHPRRLLGSAVRVEAFNSIVNSHISRCKPGMWIRIRNLYAVPGGVSAGGLAHACTVRGDSHVCQIGPDFFDVRALVRRYTERVARSFVQQVTRVAAPAAVSLPAPAPRTVPAVASVAANAPPQLSYKESVTPIALVRAGPAPAKYCVQGRIESWWPPKVDEFVAPHGTDEHDTPTLMFALRVTDSSSASIQVLFEGLEAEKFLGFTAPELVANATSREKAQRRLLACRDMNLQCEYKVKVFVSKETVLVTPPSAADSIAPGAVSKKRSRGKNGSRATEETYVRKHKRMIAFDAMGPTLPPGL